MTPQERNEIAQEARVFYAIAPLVGPILAKRRANTIMRMRQAHQAGEKDHTALVAELSVIDEIADEITRKSNEYNSLLEDKNGK